jgi:hypothetical protein
MWFTRLGHSCARLEKDGAILVIDPGIWTDAAAALAGIAGPWLTAAEMIDYFRTVAPARGYAIHDAILNDNGLGHAWEPFSREPRTQSPLSTRKHPVDT